MPKCLTCFKKKGHLEVLEYWDILLNPRFADGKTEGPKSLPLASLRTTRGSRAESTAAGLVAFGSLDMRALHEPMLLPPESPHAL